MCNKFYIQFFRIIKRTNIRTYYNSHFFLLSSMYSCTYI